MGYAIAMVVLLAIQVGIHLAKDGEPRKDNYSFGLCLIAAPITLWLWHGAGVFNCFN